jgi:hypothetical protein
MTPKRGPARIMMLESGQTGFENPEPPEAMCYLDHVRLKSNKFIQLCEDCSLIREPDAFSF